jgi:hypothetical protein
MGLFERTREKQEGKKIIGRLISKYIGPVYEDGIMKCTESC